MTFDATHWKFQTNWNIIKRLIKKLCCKTCGSRSTRKRIPVFSEWWKPTWHIFSKPDKKKVNCKCWCALNIPFVLSSSDHPQVLLLLCDNDCVLLTFDNTFHVSDSGPFDSHVFQNHLLLFYLEIQFFSLGITCITK